MYFLDTLTGYVCVYMLFSTSIYWLLQVPLLSVLCLTVWCMSTQFLQVVVQFRCNCHARNVAKACNFHTRALRHVRSPLTDDVAQTVACSIVASRLDYCNALLSGALAATFDKLQCAQNNLARVVCQSRGRTDARPLLHSLHWLPVRQRETGCTDSQGADHSHSNVSQRARTDPCTTSGSALFRCSDACRSSRTHRTGPSRLFCCCSIHLELSTCWHSTVRKHSHFQTSLEDPSIQTHLVLLCCIKRLCIFGPKGDIQIRYYFIIIISADDKVLIISWPTLSPISQQMSGVKWPTFVSYLSTQCLQWSNVP